MIKGNEASMSDDLDNDGLPIDALSTPLKKSRIATPRRPVHLENFTLDAKYLQEEGTILLSGVQALVRLPLDQHRADARRGLNTATMISGYRGSPIGGLDLLLQENQKILDDHEVVFQPGVNEDLGATAVFGSQLANLLPRPKYDGVLGMWYGKAPGLDRSSDAIKHGNFAGVGRYGGVLAIAGDDPNAKSSTLPSATEMSMWDSFMPVLYPGNVQEVLDFGRIGFELSRYSGLWVGFKFVTNVADEFSSAEVALDRVTFEVPEFMYKGKPWQPNQNPHLLTPYSLTIEREIMEGRLEAARLFGALNQLNRVTLRTNDDWIGIVAAGKTYYDIRQAFQELGLDDDMLQHYGIRLLKVNLLAPMDSDGIRDFAHGLEEIVVIEEKRSFLELFIRDALYNLSERPVLIGKKDELDQFFVPQYGELDSDDIARLLVRRLRKHLPPDLLDNRLRLLDAPVQSMSLPLLPMDVQRTPYYCSGCPHNTSTMNVPEGSLVGGGIGCHTMTILMDRSKDGIIGITQMGGEGAQWVGASPFTETPHIFQNLGDGTLFHSGTLAIRQAIAANANITYKLLWNSAVAMTGGQHVDGVIALPELTRLLQAEGVKRMIITSPTPDEYDPRLDWAEGIEFWHRDRIVEAQEALQQIAGVTMLIHDQECAAELRRKRRRGLAAEPATRVFINEAVCEGCGDCGDKSNCLSVFPVETEFGRKTQIHQSSCNKDYTCLKGDCPAFLTVIPNEDALKARKKAIFEVDETLPEPQYFTDRVANIYMVGIGGTGVVTTNQILATAAVIDGKWVTSLDQTGLSQKGGPVVSHLKILDQPDEGANKISLKSADSYLAFDLIGATNFKNLSHTDPNRTVAVVSTSEVPTGSMVSNTAVRYPGMHPLIRVVEEHTRASENIYFDAVSLSEALFGSHMPANMMVIGAAYQRGSIPVSAAAIEKAIELNGVAVKANLNAFRVGRKIVLQPDFVSTLETKRAGDLEIQPEIMPQAATLIDRVGAPEDSELLHLLQIRVPELIDYQNAAHAQRYVDLVREVYQREQVVKPGDMRLSEAVARYLFKLMAYKDEYEVARLHLKQELDQEITAQFGENAQIRYMLHPPLLRALGMNKKLALGRWFDNGYKLLTRMKSLRGTPLDIFGYAKVRRVERDLIRQYHDLIQESLANLSADNYDTAVELASLPDIVRGYEDIKLRNVEKYQQRVEELRTQFTQ
jgi:indolepyruvate ferredoxin oxidoreductase